MSKSSLQTYYSIYIANGHALLRQIKIRINRNWSEVINELNATFNVTDGKLYTGDGTLFSPNLIHIKNLIILSSNPGFIGHLAVVHVKCEPSSTIIIDNRFSLSRIKSELERELNVRGDLYDNNGIKLEEGTSVMGGTYYDFLRTVSKGN